METPFQAIYEELMKTLDDIQRENNNILFIAKRSTQAAAEALRQLRARVSKTPFNSDSEELNFLKR